MALSFRILALSLYLPGLETVGIAVHLLHAVGCILVVGTHIMILVW